MRWTSDSAATVYSVLYPDDRASIVDTHFIAQDTGNALPQIVPFVVGGALIYETYKLYADQRVARMGFEFWEQGYTAQPELVRLDMPIKRITQTRRR